MQHAGMDQRPPDVDLVSAALFCYTLLCYNTYRIPSYQGQRHHFSEGVDITDTLVAQLAFVSPSEVYHITPINLKLLT